MGNSKKSMTLPFKEYVDSIDDASRKSMVLAQIQLEIGKHPSTIDRYLYGIIRPDEQNRKAIAFVINKIIKPTPRVTGDDLFPEYFSYTGAHNKNSKGNGNA